MKNIVDVASSYIGQKEKLGNTGFKDSDFELKMRAVGFYSGAFWCAFFVKLVWKEAGQIIEGMNGSAWQTCLNLHKRGYKWDGVPVVGSLVVWRKFVNNVPQSSGHIGIVVSVSENGFYSIEGNTSSVNSRNGDSVAKKKHYLKVEKWTAENGLRLMGFVYPK